MRNLIDEENIENVIKYYEYVSHGPEFEQNKVYNVPNFRDIDYDFDGNYDYWSSNKHHIYKLMGNQIKVTKELDGKYLCTPDLIVNLREQFLKDEGTELNVLIRAFIHSLDPQDISDNKLSQNIEILDITIPSGTKVTKAFSLLEFDKKELDRQQNIYSVFLQSLKLSGRLVLSIDPLDYITMSVSKSGWSSCHHPNSCHGAGGLAYMNDKSSIIAYVETAEPMISYVYDKVNDIKHKIEMPNKIWRQIVTINPNHDFTVQMKHYPNNSEVFAKEVSKLLRELLEKEQVEKFITTNIDRDDERGMLLEPNDNLHGFMFYCDYGNDNLEYTTITFRSEFESFDRFEKELYSGFISQIYVGERVYCACGCGDYNYTNHFYIEEAYEDDDFYDSFWD